MKKIIDIAKNSRRVYLGFKMLKKDNKTPNFSYDAMKKLFVQTNGRSNDIISNLIKKKGYPDVSREGVLGINSAADLQKVVDDIRQNGFHIFENQLPAEMIASIVGYARNTPCNYRKVSSNSKEFKIEFSDDVLFDEKNLVSPLYQFSQKNIAGSEELQKLIFDESLLMVAQEYLNTRPIMDLIAMWWSVPFGGKGKSEAAQMYHFDLDRIKFIKFFFYLTDVDTETGPHCYVRGSHKRLPSSLRKQGRMTDEEVEAAFGKQNLLELYGKKGTIMAVDTRGLHKGKDLVRDKRLLFQIEFANSMFGQYYPPIKKPTLSEKHEEIYKKYRYTYEQIMK